MSMRCRSNRTFLRSTTSSPGPLRGILGACIARLRALPARPALWLLPWLLGGAALVAAGPADSKEPPPQVSESVPESESPERPSAPARSEDEIPGVELRYQIYATEETSPEHQSLDSVAELIYDWVANHPSLDVRVGVGDDDTLIVQSLGADASTHGLLKSLLDIDGGLSFHLEAKGLSRTQAAEAAELGWNLPPGAEPKVRTLERPPGSPSTSVTVEWSGPGALKPVEPVSGYLIFDETGAPALGFQLAGADAARFGELTGNNIGRQLVIAIDGVAVQRAAIENRIDGQGRVTGTFKSEEVNALAASLNAAQFPVRLQLVSEGPIERLLPEPIRLSPGQMLGSLVVGVVLVLFMLILIVSRASRGSPAPDPAG